MPYHFIHIEDSETLSIKQGENLQCEADELIIDVAYAGINRADVCSAWVFIHHLQTQAPSWD